MLSLFLFSHQNLYGQCASCTLTNELVPDPGFNASTHAFDSDHPSTFNDNTNCGLGLWNVETGSPARCGMWGSISDNGLFGSQSMYMTIDSDDNGAYDVWSIDVTLSAGKTYEFSYYIYPTLVDASTAYCLSNGCATQIANRPTLQLRVTDNTVVTPTPSTINTFNANGTTVQWTKVCGQFTATNSGNHTITIHQSATGMVGYDYGLDDISFMQCQDDPCDFTPGINIGTIDDCNVSFSVSGLPSASSDIEVLSIKWDFGDGSSGYGTSIDHIYTTTDPHTVKMEVVTLNPITGECCIKQATIGVSITTLCTGSCVDDLDDVVISHNLNTSCCIHEFSTSLVKYKEIIGWYWDFGDGSTATGRDVTHEYASSGNYTVSVTVIGRDPSASAGNCCIKTKTMTASNTCGSVPHPEESSSSNNRISSRGEQAFHFYPNPTEATFQVEFQQAEGGEVSLEILDMNGKRVQQLLENKVVPSGSQQMMFDSGALQPGIYYLHMTKNGEHSLQKMVIQH